MTFAQALLTWYDAGHRPLPWRETRDPYAIWVSEIMLQQTRVETVKGYYQRFLAALPDIAALASAPEQQLLKLWEGLGYYSRVRNMQRAAGQMVERHGGQMPADVEALRKLSGIGPYTAGAIASIAFGIPVPAVDGNVQRVVSRVCGIREDVGIPRVSREIFDRAKALMPPERAGTFSNAMMELGAMVCLPGVPRCAECPVSAHCDAFHQGDAELLPVKQKARMQRVEAQGLALVRSGERVLVVKRGQRLLQGLWVFPMWEDAQSIAKLSKALRELGLSIGQGKRLGEARHVFTHIIWEMAIYAFDARQPVPVEDGLWVDREELAALPMPTAVKTARKLAAEMLEPDS